MALRWPFTSSRRRPAALPDGARVYAVGDIHGEAALFAALLDEIERDSGERGPAEVKIVILGDFIDRGPRSADLLTGLARMSDPRMVVLKGNHEAALVNAYRGDDQALAFWLRFGGLATLASLGAAAGRIDPDDLASVMALLRDRIDADTIDWLDELPTSYAIGGYFFAHAGVRPGVPLADQAADDLLWIRREFLSSRRDHGKVVVHGHTIEPGAVALGRNRIGIDTGAYAHGRLTALGLEGSGQWILEAASPV